MPKDTTSTRDLADFARATFNSPLRADIESKVKLIVADQIGLQIGCSTRPWCKAVHRYRKFVGATAGNSTVAHYGDKTNVEQAAFINATFGHGEDYDDTCLRVQTHAGAVIVPTAIAMAEEVNANGEETLRAIAAGLEVMLRVAHAVSPGCLRRGHHTPQATGPYGAAVAAGLLLGLNEDELLNALAIAGSFSGGLIEYTQSGGSVKRIHTAIPTTAGIRAAIFALNGLTGPSTVLEGKKGFCNVYTDTPHIERLTAGLYRDYLISDVSLKYYNCCYFIHAPIEAVSKIVRENGIEIDDIEHIQVGTCAHATVHVGGIGEPQDALGAQFSAPFSIALALLKGPPRLDSYSRDNLLDSSLRRLAGKVRLHEDSTCTAEYPENWGAIVTLRRKDGAEITERVRHAKGTAQNPMTDEEVFDKFYFNTVDKLCDAQVRALYAAIRRLGDLESISALTRLMTDRKTVREAYQEDAVADGY